MAQVVDNAYAPGWRNADTACEACGWHGSVAAMRMEPDRDATDYACPGCGNLLLIVAHPTLEQVRTAAAAGDADAAGQLALLAQFANWQAARGNGGN